MKFCLAFMCLNEVDWIKIHLPVLLKASAVDGICVVDGGSTDGTVEYLQSVGAFVVQRPWDWKPLEQENAVIEWAETCGFDAILLTAPDELWWPRQIDQMKHLLASGKKKALQFTTYNFMQDRLHYSPARPFYPDVHERAWILNQGIRHTGAIDSVPNIKPTDVQYVPHINLYHYVGIKDRRYYAWKGENFNRVALGKPLLDKPWQAMKPAPFPMLWEFNMPQPLDPLEVGIYAPVKQEV